MTQIIKTTGQVVAVKCPLCTEEFPCAKRGVLGSYNLARYDRHLIDVHKIVRPAPVPVYAPGGYMPTPFPLPGQGIHPRKERGK